MNGKLILTSGGYLDGQRTKKCDEVIEKYTKNKKVMIVKNATLSGSNVKGLPIIEKNFLAQNCETTIMTLDKNNIQKIFNFDALYFTGGDVTPLIELAKAQIVRQTVLKYLQNGGVIIGESAGSIIFGKNAKWYYDVKKGTKPKYDVVLENYDGFGFVDENIYPHWNKANQDQQQKCIEYENQNQISITKLCDGEWLEYEY